MEILNNIWYALTTENELLLNLLCLPIFGVEAFLMLKLFTSIIKLEYTKEQQNIFIALFTIFCILSYYFILPPFYSIFDYIVMFILIKKIFKISTFKSILAIISAFFVYTLVGIIVLNVFLKILSITYEQMNIIPIYRFAYLTCIYISIILLTKLFKIKKFHYSILETFNSTNKRIIVINGLFAIFTLFVQLITTFYFMNTLPLLFAMLNLMSLFAYLIVSLISLNRTINLQIKTEQLENAENYNNTLLTLYDSVRGFKHDLNNMLHLIGGYIDTNDMEGLKQYYADLRKDSVRIKNAELLNPNLINNPGIYNLIVSKQQLATDLKTNISLEVFFDFDKLKMPVYDFARILGILLDNAIEAASECEEKQVLLMFRDSPSNNTQIVSIENTYNNKEIDTNKIFEKGVTGKDKHSGIGLWEVNQIIQKHNNIVLNTSKDNHYFKQQLEIYY